MEEVLAKILGDAIELHYDFATEGGRSRSPELLRPDHPQPRRQRPRPMPDGGTFSVQLHKQRIGPSEAARRGIHSGDSIELVVADSGVGMSAETARALLFRAVLHDKRTSERHRPRTLRGPQRRPRMRWDDRRTEPTRDRDELHHPPPCRVRTACGDDRRLRSAQSDRPRCDHDSCCRR